MMELKGKRLSPSLCSTNICTESSSLLSTTIIAVELRNFLPDCVRSLYLCTAPVNIMAEMRSPPPELLDIIFSFLDCEGLWVLARVSRGFQCIALSHLFASYNLSASQVHSGFLSLPGQASFLIPRIYRIHPIQKLAILRGTLPVRSLISVLAVIPRILYVTICPSTPTLTTREVASLIALLCSVTDPVIFIQTNENGGASVFVSRLRRFPGISWEPFDTMALFRPRRRRKLSLALFSSFPLYLSSYSSLISTREELGCSVGHDGTRRLELQGICPIRCGFMVG